MRGGLPPQAETRACAVSGVIAAGRRDCSRCWLASAPRGVRSAGETASGVVEHEVAATVRDWALAGIDRTAVSTLKRCVGSHAGVGVDARAGQRQV